MSGLLTTFYVICGVATAMRARDVWGPSDGITYASVISTWPGVALALWWDVRRESNQ